MLLLLLPARQCDLAQLEEVQVLEQDERPLLACPLRHRDLEVTARDSKRPQERREDPKEARSLRQLLCVGHGGELRADPGPDQIAKTNEFLRPRPNYKCIKSFYVVQIVAHLWLSVSRFNFCGAVRSLQ